jgi:hypothetical protein
LNPKICVVTIGVVRGNRYSEFRFEWGLPLDRSSPNLSNPRKIIIIGGCTRRHAPVKAPVRKLHAPLRAAVPTVSETHSSRHRIEQWTPPSGSSSPDLKNGVKNGLIGAATRQWKLQRSSHVRYTRQRVPAHDEHAPARARHTPSPPRQPTQTSCKKKIAEKCEKIQNF